MQDKWMPVYLVVVEPEINPHFIQYQILHILDVIECDLTDQQKIWETVIVPLSGMGRNVFMHIYYREPNNPFGNFRLAKAASSPGEDELMGLALEVINESNSDKTLRDKLPVVADILKRWLYGR